MFPTAPCLPRRCFCVTFRVLKTATGTRFLLTAVFGPLPGFKRLPPGRFISSRQSSARSPMHPMRVSPRHRMHFEIPASCFCILCCLDALSDSCAYEASLKLHLIQTSLMIRCNDGSQILISDGGLPIECIKCKSGVTIQVTPDFSIFNHSLFTASELSLLKL